MFVCLCAFRMGRVDGRWMDKCGCLCSVALNGLLKSIWFEFTFDTLCASLSIVDATFWLDTKTITVSNGHFLKTVASIIYILFTLYKLHALHFMHQMIYEHGNSITQWIFIRKLRELLLFFHFNFQFHLLCNGERASQTHTSITFNSMKMGSKPLFVRVNIKSRTNFCWLRNWSHVQNEKSISICSIAHVAVI